MAALLDAPVSTGFVARARQRFGDGLDTAGFDEAMQTALLGEDVLCGGETPVNVARKDTDEQGAGAGSPHVVTLLTPDGRLVWSRVIPARSKPAIKDLGVLVGSPATWPATTTPPAQVR